MTTIHDMADYMMEVVEKDFDKEISHSVPLKPDHKYVKEYYAFLQMMMEDRFYTVWDLFRYGRLAAGDSDWLLSQDCIKDTKVMDICAACGEAVIEDDLLCESCQARDDRHKYNK